MIGRVATSLGERPGPPPRWHRVLGLPGLGLSTIALVAGLTSCGPPGSTPTAPAETTTPSTTAPVDPAQPRGDLEPDALAGFDCGPDAAGGWTATGTLTNTGSGRADYVVTVLVAGPTSTAVRAKRQVVSLASGASAPVELTALPAPVEGELSCQAQVLRRP